MSMHSIALANIDFFRWKIATRACTVRRHLESKSCSPAVLMVAIELRRNAWRDYRHWRAYERAFRSCGAA